MKIIYGSSAIKFWYPDFNSIPKDIDYISNEGQKSVKGEEYYYIPEFEYIFEKEDGEFLSPSLLYTIKLSHLSYDINWDKHMKHRMFLKEKGCKVDEYFYGILLKRWEQIHGKKKVKMNVENKYFFKENIKRKYSHDWLHEYFAFYSRPLNERIRKDLNSPLCSQDLWNKLSFEDQIKCALEEIYVLCFERYLSKSYIPINIAKEKILKQMIISTTTGWFNLFLKENFLLLLKENPKSIIDKIQLLLNEK